MTREEAKEFLIDISYKLGNMSIEYLTEKAGEKMCEAIKALEQEPCEDAISREDTLMDLTGERTEQTDKIIHHFIKRIKKLPSVNPQPKTGNWIAESEDCISREAVIDALEKVADLFPWRVPGNPDTYDSYNGAWNDAIGRAEMDIEVLPTVRPKDDFEEVAIETMKQEAMKQPSPAEVLAAVCEEIETQAKKFNKRPEVSYDTAYSDGLYGALNIIYKHMEQLR